MIRTIRYAHPVYTQAGVKAQARVAEIDGRNRTHFCGAYWGWGFRGRRAKRAARGRAVRGRAVTASCLYEGTIRHRRLEPRREFTHRLALAYVDLDELPNLLGGRLVARRPGLARFRRRDYLGDADVPLNSAVRDVVEQQTGARPEGPIRLLTQLRSLGHCFNPVSFYYCFDRGGERLRAVVAEVTNTPWGERHRYVIEGNGSALLTGRFAKAMHVSPFMGMDHHYEARAAIPAIPVGAHCVEPRRRDRLRCDLVAQAA